MSDAENLNGDSARVEKAFERALSDAFSHLPADYEPCASVLKALRDRFQSEVARAVEPRLRDEAAQRPKNTLVECRALASWVNKELDLLGLTLREPRSGSPAALIADYGSDRTLAYNRFRLHVRGPAGTSLRTPSSLTLPTLTVMPDVPRGAGRTGHHPGMEGPPSGR